MLRGRRPQSQGWKTFLCNHAGGIAAIDFLVVPTLAFERMFAFVVLRVGRRNILWIGVTTNPTAEWLANQITEAFPWNTVQELLVLRAAASRTGHSRLPYFSSITVADRLCRAGDRLNPTRMSRPHHRLERGASSARPNRVRGLLQCNTNSPRTRKGCPQSSPNPEPRYSNRRRRSMRISPSIHSDIVFGMENRDNCDGIGRCQEPKGIAARRHDYRQPVERMAVKHLWSQAGCRRRYSTYAQCLQTVKNPAAHIAQSASEAKGRQPASE
jgi:hypothetical protein